MTTKQLKTEIQRVLDEVPESVLEEVLKYLKDLRGKSTEKIQTSNNLRKIISEDRELLNRLAE